MSSPRNEAEGQKSTISGNQHGFKSGYFLTAYPWGAWSLVSLYISILSGVAVGLHYDYFTPFYSTAALDTLVPFGQFFRSLHFYSSQFCFLLAICHFIAVYRKTESYRLKDWAKLIGALFVLLFLLFTGYVLKGDSTGSSAGAIAESLVVEIPIFGKIINEIFFAISESGLRKVYVQHVIALDFALLLLGWTHLRKYRIQLGQHISAIVLIAVFCLIFAAPIEPEKFGATYISGPWFFLGLQELLRYLPPLIAGVLLPLVFFFVVMAIHPTNSHRRRLIASIILGLACYAAFSIAALLR